MKTAMRRTIRVFVTTGLLTSCALVSAPHADAAPAALSPYSTEARQLNSDLIKKADRITIVPDKGAAQLRVQSSGSKPTRNGTFMVTTDPYKGLIPLGHAAMVWSASGVVEALGNGVSYKPNDWDRSKKKAYGATVKKTTVQQDSAAARFAYRQLGKKYNYNYLDVNTRSKFYCSHLVWAAFKDTVRIDLNGSLFGRAVYPMELINNSQVSVTWRKG